MSVGRVLGTAAAAVAVAGCAVLAIGMASAGADKQPVASSPVADLPTAGVTSVAPVQFPAASHAVAAAGVSSVHSSSSSPPSAAPSSTSLTARAAAATSAASTPTHPVARTSAPAHVATVPKPSATSARKPAPKPAPRSTAEPAPKPARTTAHAPAAKRGTSLPLRYSTGSATRVITVVARSTYSTTATLQAWQKAPGGGWLRYGARTTAHVGSDGLSRYPSESRSATPIGSFTLTRAFGHYGNPGTRLPYVHTTSADWWISQSGPLYNTLQHCSSGCAFNQGSPNEHLYYETPYYNYAVVIDYNTRNTGHVRQGAGSAFFLHVTDGHPTAGCVSIPQSKLVSIMRWLTPSTHPRILIGVT